MSEVKRDYTEHLKRLRAKLSAERGVEVTPAHLLRWAWNYAAQHMAESGAVATAITIVDWALEDEVFFGFVADDIAKTEMPADE